MSSSPIAVLLPHGPVTSIAPVAVAGYEQPGLLAVLAAVPDRSIRAECVIFWPASWPWRCAR